MLPLGTRGGLHDTVTTVVVTIETVRLLGGESGARGMPDPEKMSPVTITSSRER